MAVPFCRCPRAVAPVHRRRCVRPSPLSFLARMPSLAGRRRVGAAAPHLRKSCHPLPQPKVCQALPLVLAYRTSPGPLASAVLQPDALWPRRPVRACRGRAPFLRHLHLTRSNSPLPMFVLVAFACCCCFGFLFDKPVCQSCLQLSIAAVFANFGQFSFLRRA